MCVDPEIASAINVTDIEQTRVTVLWSNGQTQVVSSTIVSYRATGAAWTPVILASQTTTHTVSGLEPGTEYQFYVKITSYGKSSTSNTVTITTGKIRLAMDMKFRIHFHIHIHGFYVDILRYIHINRCLFVSCIHVLKSCIRTRTCPSPQPSPLLFAPRAEAIIARLWFQRKFPALAALTKKDSNHS